MGDANVCIVILKKSTSGTPSVLIIIVTLLHLGVANGPKNQETIFQY